MGGKPPILSFKSTDLSGGLCKAVDQDGTTGVLDLIGTVVVGGAESLDLGSGLAHAESVEGVSLLEPLLSASRYSNSLHA